MKNLKQLLFFTCLYLFYIPITFSQPKWLNFTTIEHPENVQFQDNYAWVAGRGGLVRINRQTNESFLFHAANSNLPSNTISDIAVSPQGILWVLYSNVVGKFIDGVFYPMSNVLDSGEEIIFTGKLHFTNNGHAFASGYIPVSPGGSGIGHLIRFDENDNLIELYNSEEDIFGDSEKGFVFTSNNEFWSTGYSQNIYKIKGNGLMVFNTDNSSLPTNEVRKILKSPNDKIIAVQDYLAPEQMVSVATFNGEDWDIVSFEHTEATENFYILNAIFSPDGLLHLITNRNYTIQFDGTNFEVIEYPEANGLFNNTLIRLMAISNDNNWWLYQHNLHGDKLIEYDHTTFYHYEVSNANFSDASSYTFHVDKNNTIWYACSNSISTFDGTDWTNRKQENFSLRTVETITNNDNNQIWIGASENNNQNYVIAKYDGVNWQGFSSQEIGLEYEESTCHDLVFDKDGNLWAATGNELAKFDGTNWTTYPLNIGFMSAWIKGILITQSDEMIIETWKGLYKFDGNSFTQIPLPYVDPEYKAIFWIYEDHEGNVWVHHKDKISLYNGTTAIDITDELPLTMGSTIGMIQDLNDVYYFATCDLGLVRYDGQTWTNLNEGISQGCISKMAVDSLNNIWMGFRGNGVAVFNENGINEIGPSYRACMEGNTFFDFNENGQIDNGEVNLPYQKLLSLPDSTIRFSSIIGQYRYGVFPNTTNTVQLLIDENEWQLTSDSASFTIAVEEGCEEDLDFGISSNQVGAVGEINLTPGLPRCFLPSSFWGSVKNTGFVPFSGSYSLTVDDQITVLDVSPEPDNIDGLIYTWNLETLNPFQISNFHLKIQYPGVDAIGETITYIGRLYDEMDNLMSEAIEEQVILCSYDPNDKSGQSVGESVDNYSLLGDALEYLIRFENTGNDTAFRVVIKDTLSQFLDINTFEIISSSHAVDVSIQHREVVFTFNPILLPYSDIDPVGSQGYVKFSISPIANLSDNQIINNTAFIYFDFNPAIITNTTENILVEELPFNNVDNNRKLPSQCQLSWSPNPFSVTSTLTIPDNFLNGQFTLVDSFGRQVLQKRISAADFTLEKGNLKAGIYFYQLQKDNDGCSGKLLIY